MNQIEYINLVAPIIQKYASKYEFKIVSPIIAQACIESGYGISTLASKYHNHFGMKCGSSWGGSSVNMKTSEYYPSNGYVQINDNFRAYPTLDSGIEGYFVFTSTSRYKNLKSISNPYEYACELKRCGYATSPTYVDTIMKVIQKYDLTQFDSIKSDDPYYSKGNVYELQDNVNIRCGCGTSYPLQMWLNITKDGKSHCTKEYVPTLKKGTKVTCKNVIKNDDGSTWLQIPSGFVCAITSDHEILIK